MAEGFRASFAALRVDDASARAHLPTFDGPGVPYEHKFSPVSRGPRGVLTLGGDVAADLVCWEWFFRRPCPPQRADDASADASCALCHDFGHHDETCGGRIREALGQLRAKGGSKSKRFGCRYGERCSRAHPTDDRVRQTLSAWWRANRGGGEVDARWSVLGSGMADFRARNAAGRAAASAGDGEGDNDGDGDGDEDQTSRAGDAASSSDQTFRASSSAASSSVLAARGLSTSRFLSRLRERSRESPYAGAFEAEPFFHRLMSNERLCRLFADDKRSYKEVTEAYGAARRVSDVLARLGASPDGGGAVLFDACSGRGIAAVLYAHWFPRARVVMMDANGEMDLSHLREVPNLRFRHVDLFGESVVEAVREECAEADAEAKAKAEATAEPERKARETSRGARVLVGTHLCGALSPRLIDLAFGVREMDAMILCPCCIKGQLGTDCRYEAKRRGCDPYVVLCETLRAFCRRELRRVEAEEAEEAEGDKNRVEGFAAVGYDAPTRGVVLAEADPGVLSPVNCFITVVKRPEVARPPREP